MLWQLQKNYNVSFNVDYGFTTQFDKIFPDSNKVILAKWSWEQLHQVNALNEPSTFPEFQTDLITMTVGAVTNNQF